MRRHLSRLFYVWLAVLLLLAVLLTITLQDLPYPAAAFQGTSEPANIHLFPSENAFVIYIASDVDISLEGLELRVSNDGTIEVRQVTDDFNGVFQLTSNIGAAHTCFVYEVQDTNTILPGQCNDDVHRQPIHIADRFWYDNVRNQSRAIAVSTNGAILETCPASSPDCPIFFQTSTPNAAETTIPTIEPSPIPPPNNTEDNLEITVEESFFVLHVISSERVSIEGIEFVTTKGRLSLVDAFPILASETMNFVPLLNTCFVIRTTADITDLSSLCPESQHIYQGPTFPATVAFWYEQEEFRTYNIEVFNADEPTGYICNASSATQCTFRYVAESDDLPTITPEPTQEISEDYTFIQTSSSSFYIRIASISQIDYNEFILSDTYDGDRWWTAEGLIWRARQGTPRTFDNRDVPAHVIWHEADAYCRWQGGRLPSEEEWRAAYGQELFREQFIDLTEWTRTQFVEGASPITYAVLQTQGNGIQRIESTPDNPFVEAGFRCVLFE